MERDLNNIQGGRRCRPPCQACSSGIDAVLGFRIKQVQLLKIGRQHQLLLFRLLFARVFEHHDLFPYPHIDQIGVAQRFDGIHMGMDGVRPVMGKL